MKDQREYSMTDRASVAILQECIDLQRKKGQDYNGATTSVQQADYYPSGVKTIHEIMHAKMLRAKSVMEQMEQGGKENFESLEDTYKDLINYASFAVAYLRYAVPGQAKDKDIFNRGVREHFKPSDSLMSAVSDHLNNPIAFQVLKPGIMTGSGAITKTEGVDDDMRSKLLQKSGEGEVADAIETAQQIARKWEDIFGRKT